MCMYASPPHNFLLTWDCSGRKRAEFTTHKVFAIRLHIQMLAYLSAVGEGRGGSTYRVHINLGCVNM